MSKLFCTYELINGFFKNQILNYTYLERHKLGIILKSLQCFVLMKI